MATVAQFSDEEKDHWRDQALAQPPAPDYVIEIQASWSVGVVRPPWVSDEDVRAWIANDSLWPELDLIGGYDEREPLVLEEWHEPAAVTTTIKATGTVAVMPERYGDRVLAKDVSVGDVVESASGEQRTVTKIEEHGGWAGSEWRQRWVVLLDEAGDCLIVGPNDPVRVVRMSA
jgi:hypothetical protein